MIGENQDNIKKFSGWKFLILSLISFMALLEEFLLTFIETKIYGVTNKFSAWTSSQMIIHWIIISILWGLSAYFILRFAVNKYGFKMQVSDRKIAYWKYLVILFIFILVIFISHRNWEGFKVLKEYQNNGLLRFVFQYIYYFFESVLFTLIIVFAQKAFEIFFKRPNINYGGIICALTWGLIHIISQSSIEVGILGVLYGFCFGSVYLLLDRNLFKVFPVIYLMFVL